MKNTFKSTLLIAFIGLLALSVSATEKGKPEMAATVSMEGTIVDADTQETLAGVSIKVVGTDLEVKTDLDGNFTICGLSPGEYNIEISYISYKETKAVLPLSNNTQKHINLSLKSE
ncbi:MAG: carboxypeptidase-like regulatory domain-containing protein [Bacteroidales bacterium]|nr:carboxypeptidase-like regulatory domain-containing protein [Bacteroidales bacterium]